MRYKLIYALQDIYATQLSYLLPLVQQGSREYIWPRIVMTGGDLENCVMFDFVFDVASLEFLFDSGVDLCDWSMGHIVSEPIRFNRVGQLDAAYYLHITLLAQDVFEGRTLANHLIETLRADKYSEYIMPILRRTNE